MAGISIELVIQLVPLECLYGIKLPHLHLSLYSMCHDLYLESTILM